MASRCFQRFIGFPNVDEEALDQSARIPFSLEDKLTSLGGIFERVKKPFGGSRPVVLGSNLDVFTGSYYHRWKLTHQACWSSGIGDSSLVTPVLGLENLNVKFRSVC